MLRFTYKRLTQQKKNPFHESHERSASASNLLDFMNATAAAAARLEEQETPPPSPNTPLKARSKSTPNTSEKSRVFGGKFTNSEIKRLGRRFAKLDKDHSGTVSLQEFLQVPEIKKNVLANRIVEVFDTNNDGEVDFREFILGMSQFANNEKTEGLLRFTFKIFDIDNNGYISNSELFQVLKAMVGNNMTDIQIQQTVDHTFQLGDTNHDGVISFKEFSAMVGPKNPALNFNKKIYTRI